jgi:hypothetical protein
MEMQKQGRSWTVTHLRIFVFVSFNKLFIDYSGWEAIFVCLFCLDCCQQVDLLLSR